MRQSILALWPLSYFCGSDLDSDPASVLSTTTAAACAQVSSSWAAQVQASPSATPTVSASLAHECLKSIPLGKEAALELVDAIAPYLEWESDSAYLADPPRSYYYPGYDMFAALAAVRSNLVADRYEGEYDFQMDLFQTVFAPAHNGHFVFYPDAVTRVFEFTRQRSLVSISEDGTSVPVIKLYEDVTSAPETASVVRLINGVDAAKYVLDTVTMASYSRDPDSAYNSMFFEKAQYGRGGGKGFFSSGGRIRFIYQGPETVFTFENGTVLRVDNTAVVKANMTGVVDGASYYGKFCVPQPSHAAPSPASNSTAPARNAIDRLATLNGTVPGYPRPVVISSDGIVSGYYLSDPDHHDVAVLVLLAFMNTHPAEFQSTVSSFLARARADGKTKLIIDTQANDGGYLLQGFDLFGQLFPSLREESYSRFRLSPGLLAVTSLISTALADLDPSTSPDADAVRTYASWANYRSDLDATLHPFGSWEDKFAPGPGQAVYKNTSYSALLRWNLTDPLTTTNDSLGIGLAISGQTYNNNNNNDSLTPPFAAEDVVLLHDGACASTCFTVSALLARQAGTRSVAVGGRPGTAGRIPGVGGVKGGQSLSWAAIYGFVRFALERAGEGVGAETSRRELERYTDLPMRRSTASAVNVRDAVLPGNLGDGVPAQFVEERADCRLYWTEGMVKDVEEVWVGVARVAFGDGECVAGGLGRGGGGGGDNGDGGGGRSGEAGGSAARSRTWMG